jgi:hypothetical protein
MVKPETTEANPNSVVLPVLGRFELVGRAQMRTWASVSADLTQLHLCKHQTRNEND